MSRQLDISHSFTDLMTSLAIIFILLLVATIHNNAAASAKKVAGIREQLVNAIKDLNLAVATDRNDPNSLIVKLDESKLKFKIDDHQLLENDKVFLNELFTKIVPLLCTPEYIGQLESIIVEGHTDSTGNKTLAGQLKNVKLSQDRAYSVMTEAFITFSKPEKFESLKCIRNLASATGKGSSRPLEDRPDDENRRVEIKIRIKPQLLSFLKAIPEFGVNGNPNGN